MTILSAVERNVISNFCRTKRLIGVIVKGQRDFFVNLENLSEQKPSDVALIAFTPIESVPNQSPSTVKCFDLIVHYDDSSAYGRKFRTFEDIEVPKLDTFADELVSLVPKEKICLIHCEENSISAVCRTRKRSALTGKLILANPEQQLCLGAYPEDALYMGRKDEVYRIAERAGIAQPKSVFVNVTCGKSKTEIIDDILTEIPTFPMFRKPQMLMGLRGVMKIESKDELETWIDERLKEADPETYIIQVFVTGTEFTISTVLLQDGTWKPLIVKYVAFEWSHSQCLSSGRPVMSIVEPFDEAEQESFPGINDFTKKVIETFKPKHPQVFCFQGFQRTRGQNDYILNELAYRPAGERVNTLCYQACGVNQYTALVMASIDPHYVPKPSKSWHRKIITGIWYPKREGVLAGHREFPKYPEIKGRITGDWHVNVNDRMEKARNMGHMITTMFLESSSKEERDEDLKWIADNWTPDVN